MVDHLHTFDLEYLKSTAYLSYWLKKKIKSLDQSDKVKQ